MHSLLQSEEFIKLETEYPFLKRARGVLSGLRALDCVVVDIETTGLEPEQNEIIEIAALKIVNGEVKDVYNPLIRIAQPLSQLIVNLTGITDEMLADGEEKTEALQKFLDFAGQLPLIAHNTDFDIPFLKHHTSKTLNLTLNNPLICTLKLSRKFLPGLGAYKLQKVAEYFKVETLVLHRAVADAEITYQVWLKLIEVLEKNGITSLETILPVVN